MTQDSEMFWKALAAAITQARQLAESAARPLAPLIAIGLVGEDTAPPASFPKDTRRARKIWKIVKQTEREFLDDFKRSYRDDPAPSDTELIDAVNEQVEGRKYRSAKRIRDFVKWGDAGLLE